MHEEAKYLLLQHFVYDSPYDKNDKKINAIGSMISILQRVLPFAQAEYTLNILNNLVIDSKSYLVDDDINLKGAITILVDYLISLASH